MLVQLVVFLAGRLAMPSWLLQLLITLAPQLEAQIPKAKLEQFALEVLQAAAAEIGRESKHLWVEFLEYVKAHPPQPSGPPDYGGNEPAHIDWGPNPTGPAKPPPDEDFQP